MQWTRLKTTTEWLQSWEPQQTVLRTNTIIICTAFAQRHFRKQLLHCYTDQWVYSFRIHEPKLKLYYAKKKKKKKNKKEGCNILWGLWLFKIDRGYI